MKRYIIWSSLVVVLIVAAVAIARAEGRGWCDHGWHHHGPLSYVAHELDLSQAQKSQIQSIWQSERPTISALAQEFSAEAKEMDTATVQGNLDESKVQEIATRQGTTITKLLVEKERLKSKIYTTVLNPEQRTKADALQERWHSRLDRIADRIGND
jgi:Spy/CpxP family protein refolding chaperone